MKLDHHYWPPLCSKDPVLLPAIDYSIRQAIPGPIHDKNYYQSIRPPTTSTSHRLHAPSRLVIKKPKSFPQSMPLLRGTLYPSAFTHSPNTPSTPSTYLPNQTGARASPIPHMLPTQLPSLGSTRQALLEPKIGAILSLFLTKWSCGCRHSGRYRHRSTGPD
jgi:hypothetical protein